jgi:sec-independent protein translocase protein TatC
MATLLRPRQISDSEQEELGGQMSFLDHLDELRRRLIRSLLFVFLAMTVCWFFSDRIYSFRCQLSGPSQKRNDNKFRLPG